MRKQYKKKKRSCALCKPHKMGWENRWKRNAQIKMETSEEEILEAIYGVNDETMD